MQTILGMDAAWTPDEPSGVALVGTGAAGWRCLAVAPSYETFLGLERGKPIDWEQPWVRGGQADINLLLKAAREIAGHPVDVITVDMPIATVPILCRRHADNEVSAEFGSRWCSAHTPSPARPGALGLALSSALVKAGYPIATGTTPRLGSRLLEVYPHPALLSLLARSRRVPYKVSKSRKYWPEFSVSQRIEALVVEFSYISAALTTRFGELGLRVPDGITTLAHLKRYEDCLDALVCAWVGVEHLAGRTVALGDNTAAIWCPTDVVLDPRAV